MRKAGVARLPHFGTLERLSQLTVLRVFVGPDGRGGNPLGVFLDGAEVPEADRQAIATELGFSETVFVDDRAHGEIRMYTPADEISFAGHPTVGTAWLLAQEGPPPRSLHTRAGEVGVRFQSGQTFISAKPEWTAPFEYVQLGSPTEIDRLTPTRTGETYFWAWIDEEAGSVRARGFYPVHGIEEDEATGSAALTLSATLGRALEVRQGTGSLLYTLLPGDGRAEVGGHTELVERRDFAR